MFESERITVRGDSLSVRGKLTMRGQSRDVTIPFKRVQGKNGAGKVTTAFKGKMTLDRNAWGVGSGSVAAKISLEDEVELDLLLVAFL